jgi:putative PIN family toxin of toxin-antitoxin system
MIAVTLDTATYVRALLFGGAPLELLGLASQGQIRLFISEPILQEVLRALRDKFRRDIAGLHKTERVIRRLAQLVTPTKTLNIIKYDEPDNRVLECAQEAKADYIVSGDPDVLRLKPFGTARIVKVDLFMRFARAQSIGK